ncbi:transmembrane protein 179B isoform X2 [Hippopotamus amphibius kiboko]|uniref:transmembrane protein 179B isoform X2 n=1 Tax=Hippopotamus amphibius kiboko TaxID=575201 RepID=UPI002595F7C6|nr:transmembrane protein 179B isoform X2 [Hippopotamus amphibius kiboko]
MALPWLQRVELAFFAVAFLCGAVAAVALTRTQVRLRVGADHRVGGPIGLRIALAISTVAIFLVLVSACIVRFGTSSLCKSIISQNITSCSDAQKTPWRPPGTALQFYSNLHNAETSSWVNLVLWCVVLVLQVVQWKSEATPHQPLERRDPVWSSETDALVGPRLSHS